MSEKKSLSAIERKEEINPSDTLVVESKTSIFTFSSYYPEENETEAVKDIANGLAHIGIFDGIKK